MDKLPELYHLTKIRWQFFGTLTFRQPSLRNKEGGRSNYFRFTKFLTFGRELCGKVDFSAQNFNRRNINALRLEQGEIGGLWHYHFLMAGLRDECVNRSTCYFMQHLWQHGSSRGGFTKVSVFDSSQNGEEYISDCIDPGKRYEFNKFGLAQSVTLSPACQRVLLARSVTWGVHRSATQEKIAGGSHYELTA